MINCQKCEAKNDDDATFCTHCGVSLRFNVESTLEQHAKLFAKSMEKMGKKVGAEMSQAAKKMHEPIQKEARGFEERMDRISRQAGSWYDRTFGVFGPLLESFIFLIVFRLILLMMEVPNEQMPELRTWAGILLVYILPFFALSLLSNYTGYLSKKFFKFKIFSPLLYAVFLVLFCLIISKILYDANTHFPTVTNLKTAALSLETSLPTIFTFAILVGYVILILNLPKDQKRNP